ncbi:MAG: AraC family transcriptional regulator [Fusicatenibacter sp.]|nr:AraC family transcriptional regulator [Lachnospiraceae bacterium]MDY2938566.1 AraC family transcriptional regulator [Fusicatenibacter sp.]
MPYLQFYQYMSMAYFAIYGSVPGINDVLLKHCCPESATTDLFEKNTGSIPKSHGSRLPEKLMLEGVRTGNIHLFSETETTSPSIVGTLSNGDPLRQAKNAIITQIALVTRAAVEGGMDAEAAYSLSDFYIQRIECCTVADEVYALSKEMYQTFVQQVHEIQTQNYSPIVIYMCTYIDKHIREVISLEEMAKGVGYDTYYLTTLFKKDTGKTIKTYILEKKVEQAKILLSSTLMETQEISDRLSFQSASYFCTQFKKITGESPLSYRKRVHSPK